VRPDPRASRAAVGFALEVPALLLALQGGSATLVGLGLAVAALAAARVVRPAPLESLLAALGVHLGGLALALGAAFLLLDNAPFGVLWTVGVLGLAAPRLAWRLTPRTRALVLFLGMLALMGLGKATSRAQFGLGTAAFLAAALLAILTAERSAPAFLRHPQGALLPMLAAFGLAGGVLAGLGVALPAAEPAVVRALGPLFGGDRAESGFGDGDIHLGHLSEIVASATVVLRVHGEADYLRGQVYADYARGRWRRRVLASGEPRRIMEDNALIFDGGRGPEVLIEAEPEAGAPLFAPLGTRRMTGMPAESWVDGYGIFHVPIAFSTEPRTWRLEAVDEPPPPIAPPNPADLGLPRPEAERYRTLARAWAGEHDAPLEQVDALRRHFLRGYTYSLELTPAPEGVDPILFFLEEDRRGHCEYFAGALVLLARGLDIPARLVSGYRVFEHNMAGGWYVVRQRDAHAWAEVWIDGGWRTVDPTPPGSLEGEQLGGMGWGPAQWDRFKRWVRSAAERLAALSTGELVLILFAIAALIGLLVLLRRRQRQQVGRLPPPPPVFGPLALLENALARLEPRAPHETPGRYAERLHAAGQHEAAVLVEACAAWLYGGVGDGAALEADVQRWLASRSAPRLVS